MTIGEKIKTYRKYRGITQAELAEISGVHPVTIRKYETDKMEPQPQQIEKVANALNISYSALADTNTISRMETVGDLMGLILILCKSNILKFVGEKDMFGNFIHKKTCLQINDIIANHFVFNYNNDELDISDIILKVDSEDEFENLVTWANLYLTQQKEMNSQNLNSQILKDRQQMIETLEIKLQISTDKLNTLI